MYYLGIVSGTFGDIGHDPAACLVKDNKIIAMAEEERFIRVKHAFKIFPKNAIKYCLDVGNVSLEDVKIGYYFKPSLFLKRVYHPIRVIGEIRRSIITRYLPRLLDFHFGYRPKVNYIEHHLCHTYAAFPLSGFKRSNCFSMDGVGERISTLITYCGNNVERLKEAYDPNSLGRFYGHFTQWLGFKKNNGEGKVMGLASYGDPKKIDLSNFIKFKNGIHEVKGSVYVTSPKNIFNRAVSRFGKRRTGEIKPIHKNVAASLQYKLEEIILKMVEYHQTKNLCLVGGVALNCKTNGKILQSGLIKDMFIQPVATDAGCALGAAIYLAMQDGKKFKKMEHVYYGPEYSNEEIKKILEICKVNYEYHDDIAGVCAELLVKQSIIGWFQGRMECGPRALGNRSILADPRDPEMKNKINNLVKHREPWRPFCPSLLDEVKDEYLEGAYESPFMILTFKVKEEKVKDFPAAIHVDNTCRPQTVKKEVNPLYHKLIKEFGKETGVPIILNTSFNVRGEPIVCNPTDALRCFFGTGMDYLAIGNYLVKK